MKEFLAKWCFIVGCIFGVFIIGIFPFHAIWPAAIPPPAFAAKQF
jgi:hypothetical protein